jgi:hypothetical protein
MTKTSVLQNKINTSWLKLSIELTAQFLVGIVLEFFNLNLCLIIFNF